MAEERREEERGKEVLIDRSFRIAFALRVRALDR